MHDVPTNAWDLELEELFLRTGARFCRVEARRRMRDYVRGLLGPVGRENSWQLAEYAGHATPHGPQHLLSHSRWDADGLRDALQDYVAEQLGQSGGVFIPDDTGFAAGSGAKGERFYDWAAARTPAVTEFDGDEPIRQRWMLARRGISKPDELENRQPEQLN